MDERRQERRRGRGHLVRKLSLGLCLVALMTACGLSGASRQDKPTFPVVVPFAIDQAGSRVKVAFELPAAWDDGRLRPVFIGFRAVKTPSKDDAEFQAARQVMRYLRHEPIPVRLRVWRLADGQRVPVVLHELQSIVEAMQFFYVPQESEVFIHHDAASQDGSEMMAVGHWQDGKVYYIHQFARIVPPTPGRYELEVESLASHPPLHGLRYELMVSHYHVKGIE